MKNLSRDIKDYENTIDELNVSLDNISLSRLAGQVIENIELKSGVNTAISHSLKVVPRYYIILRKSASASIYDGTSRWDENKVFLKSSANVTISIMLVR